MGKKTRERSLAENEAKAVARMLRGSPQKLNLVAQLIRGRKAAAALADLQFSRKRIAVDVKKCLESAIANAENNHDLDVDDLVVAQAFVGNGLVMKRPHKKCRVTIHSARPGVVIGKKGADIDKLRKKVADITSSDVVINIVEIRKPELDATLVADSIAQQLERRVAFRRAMKRAVQSAMRLGAEGIRINCSGRLGGAEIARMEWYREGRVPLHTLRAD